MLKFRIFVHKYIPMKKLVILALPFLISLVAFSQDLVIKSGAKGFYLEHKVAPKEGLFPIGRMYSVHPRHLASFNHLDFNKGLAIGQLLNIPLTDTNFKQAVNTGVPVYYIAGSKESLANVSVKYKAPINSLRTWNKLGDDNVAASSKIIVGFLITNELKDRVVTIAPGAEESVSNVKKQEVTEKKQPEPEVKRPAVPEESVSNVKKQEVAEKKQPEPEVKKPAVSEESVSNVKKAETLKNEANRELKKDDPPAVKEEPRKTEPVVAQPEVIKDDGTGYFKNNFYQQIKVSPLKKEQTVTSSIFKTVSGWQDGKYYLLINGVEPGTIVKLTNPSNSKTVFAKVLYSMDKIRENQGVDVRISDATAASLAVNETDKFILKVNY